MTLDEFRERRGEGLRPYAEDGEVAEWQLEMALNEVGRSFLVLDAYLTEGKL